MAETWEWRQNGDALELIVPGDRRVLRLCGESLDLDDQRLIESAPDLLWLAETLVEYLTAPSNPEGATRDMLIFAQTVIRKAKEE
jgi:hypothetical protein